MNRIKFSITALLLVFAFSMTSCSEEEVLEDDLSLRGREISSKLKKEVIFDGYIKDYSNTRSMLRINHTIREL